MKIQMDPLDNPLTTRPIQITCEMSIELYPNWPFWCIEDPDRQFGKGLVPTRMRTRSAGPELLITLISTSIYYSTLHTPPLTFTIPSLGLTPLNSCLWFSTRIWSTNFVCYTPCPLLELLCYGRYCSNGLVLLNLNQCFWYWIHAPSFHSILLPHLLHSCFPPYTLYLTLLFSWWHFPFSMKFIILPF